MMMTSGSEVVILPSPKPREATVMCLIRMSFREGPDEEQNCGHQANQESSSSIQKPDQTQDVGVMQFANQETFSSREFGPYGSSSPHFDPYREGNTWFRRTWMLAEESL
uniref:Uncharacterized protein n=1 Tax=Brassica campestris TaxID=3711 RepID=M4FH78_BRACM